MPSWLSSRKTFKGDIMIEGIESVTTQALSMALDASALRQQVLATNIANVNTIGYIPQRLTFEGQMDEALRAVQTRGSTDTQALNSVQLQLVPMLDVNGQPAPVQLDAEMAEVARNAVHYQALVKGLSRHFAILSSAVSDGKK
jgi:flagellar basal-body rod protein FlgB